MFEKDKLFDYAFGELGSHETQVFEASLLKDDSLAKEAIALQALKADLVSLRDIPEMQYSKERLRDAILGQGLKPTKPGLPWLNLLLAPTAIAGVIALGFVLMNGTSRKNPQVIGTPLTALNSGLKAPQLPDQKITPPSPVVAFNSEDASGFPDIRDTVWAWEDPDGTMHSSRSQTRANHSSVKPQVKRSHSTPTYTAFKTPDHDLSHEVSGAVTGAALGGVGTTSDDSSIVALADPSKQTASADNPMIMINKDLDSGVGAPVAIEVNDSKNVIIGG